jgi:hypothetical protein
MGSNIIFTTWLARLGSMATSVGYKVWDRVRIVLKRIYIFFAEPKVVILHEDIPYYRKDKSEAQKAIDKIMSKISRG